MVSRATIGITIIFAGLFAGCCNCPTQRANLGPLPSPISLNEQVALLNVRVRAIPRLYASTGDRGVELRYPDNDGHEQTQNIEGILQLRQPTNKTAGLSRADVRIIGTAFSQTVLDAGRNQTDWWVILGQKDQTARVGDSRKAIDWSRFRSAGENALSILRPDLVQDMLGLTELGRGEVVDAHASPSLSDDILVMRVDDALGINDLLLGNESPDLRNYQLILTREIVVDRRSGDIREVRLYDPRGVVVVSSLLEDYRPVAYAGENNDAVQSVPPRVPFRVRIDYPAEHLSVSLKFEKMTIRAQSNAAAFETPDFEGMHVIREP